VDALNGDTTTGTS